jgi:Mrp family chromosome partitioning ATPase
MPSPGLINPGESSTERRRRELTQRIQDGSVGCHRIAVISLKGGVGKTTMSVCLGAVLASVRPDRVIAVDANPDRGTLAGKVAGQSVATVRDLLDDLLRHPPPHLPVARPAGDPCLRRRSGDL